MQAVSSRFGPLALASSPTSLEEAPSLLRIRALHAPTATGPARPRDSADTPNLEAGVRAGSSLALWSEYFPLGRVVGVDKDLSTFLRRGRPLLERHGALTRGNVHVLEANATDASVLDALAVAGFRGAFADVVVDDANHWAKEWGSRWGAGSALGRAGGV